MMIQSLVASLLVGLSSMAYAGTYSCENATIAVQTQETASSQVQTLVATAKDSGEVLFSGEGEILPGTGVDATFSAAGQAILIIAADGTGELTLPSKSFVGLDCVKN